MRGCDGRKSNTASGVSAAALLFHHYCGDVDRDGDSLLANFQEGRLQPLVIVFNASAIRKHHHSLRGCIFTVARGPGAECLPASLSPPFPAPPPTTHATAPPNLPSSATAR